MKRAFLLLTLCLLNHHVAMAEEFKCVVTDNTGGRHIILIDTSDMKDARRAAAASTVENNFGRSSPVEKILECKREKELFTSPRARALDQQTPR